MAKFGLPSNGHFASGGRFAYAEFHWSLMMSQLPPPPPLPPSLPPINYASAYVQPADPRPGSVKVIAILAIIFGSLGALGGVCSVGQYLGLQLTPNPVIDGIRGDRLMYGVTVASLVAHLAISVVQLLAGVAALKLRPFGRKGLIGYAVVNIVMTIAGLVLNVTLFQNRSAMILKQAGAANPVLNSPGFQLYLQFATYVLPLIVLIWPGLVWFFMTRRDVKEVFARYPKGLP